MAPTPRRVSARTPYSGVSLAAAHAAAAVRPSEPLYRFLGGADANLLPGADDERAERRRACRQQRRPPGVHDLSGRVPPSFAEALRWGAEIFHRPEERAQRAGATSTSVGDEGGFAPDLGSNREAIELVLSSRSRRRATAPASRWPSPSTRPRARSTPAMASTTSPSEEREEELGRNGRSFGRTGLDALSDHLHRGRPR